MEIECDRVKGVMTLSHASYITELAAKFDMSSTTHCSVPAQPGKKLTSEGCPATFDQVDKKLYKRYRSMLGAIAHVCNWTHPEMAYAVSVAYAICCIRCIC